MSGRLWSVWKGETDGSALDIGVLRAGLKRSGCADPDSFLMAIR
jgi:hypothetical protein